MSVPAGLSHVATFKSSVSSTAVIMNLGKGVEISQAALSTYDTVAKLLAEAESQAEKSLPDVFFHINKDGSIAVAIGQEPDTWPEDEPKD